MIWTPCLLITSLHNHPRQQLRLAKTCFAAFPETHDQFTEHGQIVIGHMEPVGGGAIAAEGSETFAILRRRQGEPLRQLLARLDLAIESATIDDVYIDEVNTPQSGSTH